MEIIQLPDEEVGLYVQLKDLPGDGRGTLTIRAFSDRDSDDWTEKIGLKFVGPRWKMRVIAEAMIAALDGDPTMQPLYFPLERTPDHGA